VVYETIGGEPTIAVRLTADQWDVVLRVLEDSGPRMPLIAKIRRQLANPQPVSASP
jgi:hypothetical protein